MKIYLLYSSERKLSAFSGIKLLTKSPDGDRRVLLLILDHFLLQRQTISLLRFFGSTHCGKISCAACGHRLQRYTRGFR